MKTFIQCSQELKQSASDGLSEDMMPLPRDFPKFYDQVINNFPSNWPAERKSYVKSLLDKAKALSKAKGNDVLIRYGNLVRSIQGYVIAHGEIV